MMGLWQWGPGLNSVYLFGSRFATHALFWTGYYVLFSIIWMKPEQGLFASFFLEFILMPVRILAAYCMLYLLIPSFLLHRQYLYFALGYAALIMIAGFLQMFFGYYFYENLLPNVQQSLSLSLSAWVRNAILINTTVLLLGSLKVFMLYIGLQEKIAQAEQQPQQQDYILVKSERRVCKLLVADILYIEGLGNYVTYHLKSGEKKIVYSSIKEAQQHLPDHFLRLHRSYLINKNAIESFNNDEVVVAGTALPRGREIMDAQLVETN